jgi:DNA polymerase-3 subunit beta
VTVPAHVLHEIVRKLSDGAQVEMTRDAEKERLSLRSGHSRFTLQTLAPEDFPDLAAGEFGHKFEIEAKDLKRLIDKTRFAISTEETRYYLNGIYLHTAQRGKEQTLRAVATDGHRLAQAELPAPKGANGMPGIILPRKTGARAAPPDRGERQLRDGGRVGRQGALRDRHHHAHLQADRRHFPGLRTGDPEGQRQAAQGAQRRVHQGGRPGVDHRQRARPRVKLNINGDKLVLSVNNPEGGSATEEIGVDYDSSPLEIGFNAKYLLDIANQLESETAHFQLADPGSPTMVKDESDEGALYVLMPMRV